MYTKKPKEMKSKLMIFGLVYCLNDSKRVDIHQGKHLKIEIFRFVCSTIHVIICVTFYLDTPPKSDISTDHTYCRQNVVTDEIPKSRLPPQPASMVLSHVESSEEPYFPSVGISSISVGSTVNLLEGNDIVGTGKVIDGDILHGRSLPSEFTKIMIIYIKEGIQPKFAAAFDDEALTVNCITAWPKQLLQIHE